MIAILLLLIGIPPLLLGSSMPSLRSARATVVHIGRRAVVRFGRLSPLHIGRHSVVQFKPSNDTSRQIEALRARGEGVPLGEALAHMMAARLGVAAADLAPIRLHNDSDAWALAQRLGQPVCAEGDDIFFQKGAYDLTTVRGRNLLGRGRTGPRAPTFHRHGGLGRRRYLGGTPAVRR